jgi:hypothetical protein
MYGKRFKNRRIMYFAYAPPMTVLDDVNDPDRPNLPYPNAELWQRSVYYYWWLFLRENQDYVRTCVENGVGPCMGLYDDFGDLRGDDFMAWWIAGGRDLFKEPETEGVRVVSETLREHRERTNILLSVPFTGDLDRTLREIRGLLEPEFAELRLERGPSRARYPVASKPVLSTLHRRWRILRMRREHPEMRGAAIYDQLKAANDVILQNHETDSEKASFIAKSVREAEALVKYAGLGYFPVTDERKYLALRDARETREQTQAREDFQRERFRELLDSRRSARSSDDALDLFSKS